MAADDADFNSILSDIGDFFTDFNPFYFSIRVSMRASTHQIAIFGAQNVDKPCKNKLPSSFYTILLRK
jgi:hypothetical protein